jgi:WD40 repeat protein
VEQIRIEDGQALMPQDGEPLAEAEIALVERWISQGAADDSPASTQTRYDPNHPPVYAAPPVITSLDYSPDGRWLAVSGYHEVVIHAADGSGIAKRLVGLAERIESAVFSPDGRRLAVTGGSPGRMGEVQIWDVAKGALLQAITVGYDTVYGASWSPDGALVAFGNPDNSVRAVDATTGQQVLFNGAHNDWVLETVFSVKSDHLVSVSRDMSVKLIHVATERFIDNVTSITPGALQGGLHAIARHPQKDEVLVGGADGVPKIYRMYREKARKIGDDFNLIRAFDAMPGRIFDVAYSRDGEQIVVGSSLNSSGEVRVYRVGDGQLVLKIPVSDGGIYAVAFHPQGQHVAAGGFDGQVRMISLTDKAVSRRFHPVALQRAQEETPDTSR